MIHYAKAMPHLRFGTSYRRARGGSPLISNAYRKLRISGGKSRKLGARTDAEDQICGYWREERQPTKGHHRNPALFAGRWPDDVDGSHIRSRPDKPVAFAPNTPGSLVIQTEAPFCGWRDFDHLARIRRRRMGDRQNTHGRPPSSSVATIAGTSAGRSLSPSSRPSRCCRCQDQE